MIPVFDRAISEVGHNLKYPQFRGDVVLVLEDTQGGRMRVNDGEVLLVGLKKHLALLKEEKEEKEETPKRNTGEFGCFGTYNKSSFSCGRCEVADRCCQVHKKPLSENAMEMLSYCIEQARDTHTEDIQDALGLPEEEIDRIDEELRDFGLTA